MWQAIPRYLFRYRSSSFPPILSVSLSLFREKWLGDPISTETDAARWGAVNKRTFFFFLLPSLFIISFRLVSEWMEDRRPSGGVQLFWSISTTRMLWRWISWRGQNKRHTHYWFQSETLWPAGCCALIYIVSLSRQTEIFCCSTRQHLLLHSCAD